MQPQTERRAMDLPRLPVDLLVELTHDDAPDGGAFEADAIDLGPGGIGLRAAVLPEIGQRLRCRFEVPGTQQDCEAEGQVVWTHDNGSWGGAFGLRFDGMDARTAHALEEIAPAPVEDPETPPELRAPRTVKVRLDGVASAIEGDLVTDGQTLCIEQAMPFLEVGRGAALEAGGVTSRAVLQRVRLRMDGATPKLVLELGPAEAETLDARSTDDVAGPAEAADATMQDEPLDAVLARHALRDAAARIEEADLVVARTRATVDEVVVDARGGDDDEASLSIDVDAPDAADAAAEVAATKDVGAGRATSDKVDPGHLSWAAHVRVVRRAERARAEAAADADATLDPAEESSASAAARAASAAIAEKAASLRASLAPVVAQGLTNGRAFAVTLGERLRPLAIRARDAIVALWRMASARLAARSPRFAAIVGQPPRRRTTSAPPAAVASTAPTARRSTRGQAAAEPARTPLLSRNVLIAIVASFTVGLVAYGLRSRGDASDTVEVHAPAGEGGWGDTAASALPSGEATPGTVTQPETLEPIVPGEAAGAAPAEPYGAAPAPSTAYPADPGTYPSATTPAAAYPAAPAAAYPAAAYPAATAPAPAYPGAPAAAYPAAAYPASPSGYDRAMPEASTQAGPMPAPTYPSLAGLRTGAAPTGAAPTTVAPAPAATTTGAPAAPASAGMSFGAADVPGGRTTTLHMSAPIQSLEGVADGSGFTLTVRGALSLDRAGPIAATNPSIERASILNRGDHSVLTLRFVAGRAPAYRVVANGTTLDVIVGR